MCSGARDSKLKLEAAMAALAESSTLLSASVFSGRTDQIETCFASFKRAKSSLFDAMDYHAAHLKHSPREVS